MKKGFTMMELLVVLAVLGIVGALLAPTISKILPDNNFAMFKKAYLTFSQVNEELVNDARIYPTGDLNEPDESQTPAGVNSAYYRNFETKLNIMTNKGTSTHDHTTADGVSWGYWSSFNTKTYNGCEDYNEVGVKIPANYTFVLVDINGEGHKPNIWGEDVFIFGLCRNGKVFIPPKDMELLPRPAFNSNPKGNSSDAISTAEDYLDRIRKEAD